MKKMICLAMAVCLCLGAFAGCSSAPAAAPVSSAAAAPAPAAEPAAPSESAKVEEKEEKPGISHTVTDHAGNVVEIPEKIEKVLITSITPLASVYPLVTGSTDNIIGISPSAMATAENSMLSVLFPSVTDVRTDFMSGSDINVEEILAMDPDIIFYKAQNKEEYEKLKTTGIPAVGVSTNAKGTDILETFDSWVTLLGQVFKQDSKAAEIAAYGHGIHDMVQQRIAEAGDSLEKPRILFIYSYSNGTLLTSGYKHWGQYWADSVGAINVAGEIDGKNPEVNMEQLYEWNPDMVFITNGAPYIVEDFMNNSIEGHDWSVVKAVKENKVYKNPLGIYRWYPPSPDSPLMQLWMAKTVHPELFADIDMEKEAKDYYKKFYNVELTDENLANMFAPPREAALS